MSSKVYRVYSRQNRYIRRVLRVSYTCRECGTPLHPGSRTIGLCSGCARTVFLPLRLQHEKRW